MSLDYIVFQHLQKYVKSKYSVHLSDHFSVTLNIEPTRHIIDNVK